jgi:cytochrome c oxidase subunit 2
VNGGGWFHLLPNASANARPLDELWWAMVGLCALVAVGVFTAMFVFCIRYRKGRPADRQLAKETLPVELTWTTVPFLIFMGVFVWSLTLYARSRTPPANAAWLSGDVKLSRWHVQQHGAHRDIQTHQEA